MLFTNFSVQSVMLVTLVRLLATSPHVSANTLCPTSHHTSHIYKHLQESETCKNSCSAESFTILDYATSKFQIKIKEALYIIICMFIHNTFSFIFNIILLARATDTLLDIQMF